MFGEDLNRRFFFFFRYLFSLYGGFCFLMLGPKVGEQIVRFSFWSLSALFHFKVLVLLVFSNQPPHPPFSKQRNPIFLTSKGNPQDSVEREAPPNTHPTQTPTTPAQQQRRKTPKPRIPQKTTNAHPKTPNVPPSPKGGIYGFP